ncbi:Ferric uptake regulation protein [Thalassocella blandensis]|nr:Ferric uptake regulation protein [Thalassocella blandensis]
MQTELIKNKNDINHQSNELRSAGLKVTLPRIKILEILEHSPERHLSAEDVFRALLEAGDNISLATIYRVLTQFEDAGLLESHNFDNGHKVFELNRGDHHDHMVCVQTGKVIEFHNEEIEKLQHEVADRHGLEITGHSLVLYVKPK